MFFSSQVCTEVAIIARMERSARIQFNLLQTLQTLQSFPYGISVFYRPHYLSMAQLFQNFAKEGVATGYIRVTDPFWPIWNRYFCYNFFICVFFFLITPFLQSDDPVRCRPPFVTHFYFCNRTDQPRRTDPSHPDNYYNHYNCCGTQFIHYYVVLDVLENQSKNYYKWVIQICRENM